jgi:hypothetical protein
MLPLEICRPGPRPLWPVRKYGPDCLFWDVVPCSVIEKSNLEMKKCKIKCSEVKKLKGDIFKTKQNEKLIKNVIKRVNGSITRNETKRNKVGMQMR